MCPTKSDFVVNAYGWTSTSALVILFIKELLPTFGYPARISVRVLTSIDGRRARCCRTCSRYANGSVCRFIIPAILNESDLPSACSTVPKRPVSIAYIDTKSPQISLAAGSPVRHSLSNALRSTTGPAQFYNVPYHTKH